jgi:hypothetical protein
MNSSGFYALPLWQISVLFIATIISSEFLLKSNLANLLKSVFKLLKKAFKLLQSSSISDDKKEALILLYSRKLLYYSVTFLVKILVVFFPMALAFLALFNHWEQAVNFIVQLDVIIAVTCTSFVYLFFRTKQ